MKTYLAKSEFPYLMTHIITALFGETEVVAIFPTIIYKITTNVSIESIRECKYICSVKEEDTAELVNYKEDACDEIGINSIDLVDDAE